MKMRWALWTAGAAALIAIGSSGWETEPVHVAAPPLRPEALATTAAPTASSNVTMRPLQAPTAPAGPDPLLSSDLISIFDRVLSEAQADSRSALLARAPALLANYLAQEWRRRALELLARYVDMEEALRAMPPPDARDPAQLRRTLEARDALRRQYFTDVEIDGLFAGQIRQDHFMAEKMELLANPALTPAQRAAAIAQSEQTWLSPEQRQTRQEAVAHTGVMRQTEALDARNASPHERFAARSAAYGYEVARNMAALDQENQEWNARLDRYAAAPEAEQAQLRDTLFNDTERLRLNGALAMRAGETRKPPGNGG